MNGTTAIVLPRPRQARAAVDSADHLGFARSELPQTESRRRLGDLKHRLEQRLALSPESTDASSATAQQLISVLRLQCELLDHDLTRRARRLTGIRNALEGLRGLAPPEMIYTAPVVLSREFGFARTMISTVRGSVWLPLHLHIESEVVDPQSRRFREFITGARIQLADAPLETELIRKRCGVLVPCPEEDKRTLREIVDVWGCVGYVAAPIIVQARAIGMLHADRPEPDDIVTPDHLDQLEAFAEGLAVAFESAILEQRAAQQRVAVNSLRAHVDELLRRSAPSALWPLSDGLPAQQPDALYRADQPAVPSLTTREREIISYVATGATNSQIARCLAISEGTVKTHLKHIARKLNTTSRAAAVAAYAGIATTHPSESR